MWSEILRQAWRNLGAHRRRAILTLLSIAVGIFSVSAVQVFTYSMERTIVERFERFGVSIVYVHHFPWKFGAEGDWMRYFRRPRVSLRDLEGLREGLRGEAWVALMYGLSGQTLRRHRTTHQGSVRGVSEEMVYAASAELRQGRYFRPEELRRPSLVAVLGAGVAKSLCGNAPCIGEKVWYEGRPLEVIGVLKSQGLFGGDDQAVFVPLPLLIRIHGLSRYGGKGDANLLVKAKNAAVLPIGELERRVRIVLRQVRHLPPKAEDNFAINRQDALLDQVKSIVGYVQIVGLFIAAFSLLVGATGVANILYVSVRERQGEIGIQRAMGAPRAFVLGLFIVEGSYLALIGGGVGVLLTGLLMMGAKPFLAQEGLVLGWSLGQVGKAVLLALGVGFIAALAPAYRAARLQPMEAIRGA